MLAGQPIAMRVSGDPNPSNNGLFFIYTDHLGSGNTITNASGTAVAQKRFLPFGEYRSGFPPISDLTDRGFTGHLHNDDLGLIYMNARYYVPQVGRFASADTIVPDPKNPQSYNRYSYVRNSPLILIDPSGHCEGEARSGEDDECWNMAQQFSEEYGIDINFLGTLNLSQMRFFIDGLNYARGIDNNLSNEMIMQINGLSEQDPHFFRQALKNMGLDVIGFRVDGGGGYIIGGQLDLDFLFNLESLEFSIFVTPGAQVGAIVGASGNAGIYFGFNTPNNDPLQGWGWGVTATGTPGVGGGVQYNRSGSSWSLVPVASAGEELDITIGGGYSIEILRTSYNVSGEISQIIWFPQSYYWAGYWQWKLYGPD